MSSTAKSTRESRRVSVTALVSLAHQQQQEDIEDELSKGLSVCSRSLCGCLFFFFLVLLAEMEGSVGQKAMACLFSSGGGLAGHWCTQGASSVSLLCWASIAKDTNSICCQKKKKKKKKHSTKEAQVAEKQDLGTKQEELCARARRAVP